MSREIYRRSVGPHLDRVRYDGGTVPLDIQALIAIQRYYEERKDSIKLLYFPALTGNKIRVSGANNYISKGYDISPNSNDATQSTAVNQPYLGGNIAPNERYSLKNPNAGSNYMTHPIISFANGSNFSITTILNWNGNASVGCEGIYGGGYRSRFDIDFLTDYIRLATDGDVNFVIPNSLKYKRPGKSVIFTFVCSDSKYLLYANGNLIYTSPDILNTAFVTNYINRVWNPSFSYVKFYAHIIRSQALTPTEVANEYNLLRSYIPEIESVQIGTQTWATSNYEAVCTPQGNLIPEVQNAATWATSQTLYDNAYAATSGTTEQKTYAAVKAAAMWCHYNNDPAIGAIYGKLYNWFAVKLLQMDIDYYNAANPTTPWGWRVPTQADFTTLSTYLGGDSVSGGKLKKEGLVYWSSPNTGATNESGFSGIPSGTRRLDGTYDAISYWFRLWTVSVYFSPTHSYSNNIYYNSNVIELSQITSNILGYPLRLIK